MTITLDVTTTMILDLVLKLLKVVIIMGCTRLIIRNVIPNVVQLCNNNNMELHATHMITKITRYLIMIIGASIALQNIGLDISMFLTAFGVTGIVLSYGMKDIVANFIASVLIIGYKQIKINDEIRIKDWQGIVVDINLRYTTLVKDSETIYVPNLVLYTQPVAVLNKK